MKALITLFSILHTIVSTLPAHTQRQEQVLLKEGKNTVEVYTAGDREDLTCVFTHLGVTVSQHTHHCFITTNPLDLPAPIGILVVNNANHPIHYYVKVASVP